MSIRFINIGASFHVRVCVNDPAWALWEIYRYLIRRATAEFIGTVVISVITLAEVIGRPGFRDGIGGFGIEADGQGRLGPQDQFPGIPLSSRCTGEGLGAHLSGIKLIHVCLSPAVSFNTVCCTHFYSVAAIIKEVTPVYAAAPARVIKNVTPT